jgi:hypothetical protein
MRTSNKKIKIFVVNDKDSYLDIVKIHQDDKEIESEYISVTECYICSGDGTVLKYDYDSNQKIKVVKKGSNFVDIHHNDKDYSSSVYLTDTSFVSISEFIHIF